MKVSSDANCIIKMNKEMRKGKHVVIEDIWDHFTISFSVFMPPDEDGDSIRIIGSIKEL